MKTTVLILMILVTTTLKTNPGFVCGNHEPSHYATSAQQVDNFTEKYGCSIWSYVSNRAINGRLIDSLNEPLAGARIRLTDHLGNTLSTSTTDDEGSFHLEKVPNKGKFSMRVTLGEETFLDKMINVKEVPVKSYIVQVEQ